MKTDLHAHSRCSDGALEVEELIDRACAQGLDILALSDHDTVSGVDRALIAAQGKLILVPGIELSTTWKNTQIHIVGLFIDNHNQVLIDVINEQNKSRLERSFAIGRKLEKLGFKDAYERTKAQAGENAIITRGNYARYLYSIKAGCSIDDAFNTYLKRGKKAYVKTEWISVEKCVQTIKAAGGIAVLAHPKRYEITNMKLKELIADFKACGGEAMEVSNCQQKPDERQYLARLCQEFELYASMGSDFHNEGTYRELGMNLELPNDVTSVLDSPIAKSFLASRNN